MTKDQAPIAIMVRGKTRHERVDMTEWLIENEYLPMFPQYMENAGSFPLTRLQTVHEIRPILDKNPDWVFVLHGFRPDSEATAREYIEGTKNNWELLV